MRKKKILWAAFAALIVLTGGCLCQWLPAEENGTISYAPTPSMDVMQDISTQTARRTEPPSELRAPEQPTASHRPTSSTQQKNAGAAFRLTMRGKEISVAYGVSEEILQKSPGWLTTSALPGENGMCVVYGHRNRTHLRILESVQQGDIITVTRQDRTAYSYTVEDIQVYENTKDLQLPLMDGKTLALVTCYPFHYSGNAPGKFVVYARIEQPETT